MLRYSFAEHHIHPTDKTISREHFVDLRRKAIHDAILARLEPENPEYVFIVTVQDTMECFATVSWSLKKRQRRD